MTIDDSNHRAQLTELLDALVQSWHLARSTDRSFAQYLISMAMLEVSRHMADCPEEQELLAHSVLANHEASNPS